MKTERMEEFERTGLLLGNEGLERLGKSTVAVFGVGGVGSHCIEALARSGVGKLILADSDVVSRSNINRQSVAFQQTIGLFKTKVMEEMIHQISPETEVVTMEAFVLPDNLEELLAGVKGTIDYIVDAIDTVTAKLALAEYAQKYDIPLIASMGTGNKLYPELFQIDEECSPTAVAGCPPDYFSATGQLWGNPLYDWDYLEATDYEWWFERIKAASKLYDITRIDHFRAFASYYSIPYPAENAINGEWVEGPRIKFFNMMEEALGKIDIVAEDLGTLTPDVTELMEQTGYPGMKVLEFAFDSGEENDYLPHKYTENCVVYTGTHDNDTVMGWLETAKPEDVNYARSYCQMPDDEPFNWGLIRVAYESKADTAIVPMQDILGLGKEARMNIPSTLGGNWVWRLNGAALTDELADKLKTMSEKSGRLED